MAIFNSFLYVYQRVIHYTISMSETSSAQERSRSPPRRGSLRMGGRVLPQTGGFTDKAREMRVFFGENGHSYGLKGII